MTSRQNSFSQSDFDQDQEEIYSPFTDRTSNHLNIPQNTAPLNFPQLITRRNSESEKENPDNGMTSTTSQNLPDVNETEQQFLPMFGPLPRESTTSESSSEEYESPGLTFVILVRTSLSLDSNEHSESNPGFSSEKKKRLDDLRIDWTKKQKLTSSRDLFGSSSSASNSGSASMDLFGSPSSDNGNVEEYNGRETPRRTHENNESKNGAFYFLFNFRFYYLW